MDNPWIYLINTNAMYTCFTSRELHRQIKMIIIVVPFFQRENIPQYTKIICINLFWFYSHLHRPRWEVAQHCSDDLKRTLWERQVPCGCGVLNLCRMSPQYNIYSLWKKKNRYYLWVNWGTNIVVLNFWISRYLTWITRSTRQSSA